MTTTTTPNPDKNQINTYGCSLEQVESALKRNTVFCNFGPVMYVAHLIDKANTMLDSLEDADYCDYRQTEIKQVLNQAKWVLANYVMGDDE
jgi:hypothetical protein